MSQNQDIIFDSSTPVRPEPLPREAEPDEAKVPSSGGTPTPREGEKLFKVPFTRTESGTLTVAAKGKKAARAAAIKHLKGGKGSHLEVNKTKIAVPKSSKAIKLA